jgi:hypothetical protein
VAAGRVTKVRAGAGFVAPTPTGRVSRARALATAAVVAPTPTGRVTRVRARSTGSTSTTVTVQPYDTVNLGITGTWTQTSGPTVTVPTFTAPAFQFGAALSFTNAGNSYAVTVKPHTMFRIVTGGLQPSRTYLVGTIPGSDTTTYSDTYSNGY